MALFSRMWKRIFPYDVEKFNYHESLYKYMEVKFLCRERESEREETANKFTSS